ncbi:MAG: hypothetical protein NZ108_11175, partial [Bacteroidia bacterium]|nr:hypothetical protein [Bacteroidia bacterium]
GCPGSNAASNVITITVNADFVPGSITGGQTLCTVSTPVSAINSAAPASGGGPGTITYQWEISQDGGLTWSNATGTGATTVGPFTPTAPTQKSMYRRRATHSGCGGTKYSNTVTLDVVNLSSSVVGQNGTNVFVQVTCDGATFNPDPWQTISGTGAQTCNNSTVLYQWQQSTNCSAWSDITGATSENLDLGTGSVLVTTCFRRLNIVGTCTTITNVVRVVVDNTLCINLRWKPGTTGNWNVPANWEKFDYILGAWVPACDVPNANMHVKIGNDINNNVIIPNGTTFEVADISLGANARITFAGNNAWLRIWGHATLTGLLQRGTGSDRVRTEIRGNRCSVTINP